ncbi:SOS response-associated peptidase [Pseudomonas sp. CrR25]|nr:SOS response-associated peptidase [Pseudomonas sp. CrR25]
MCGRYVTREEAAMERAWHIGARNSGQWIRQCYNVAPTMAVPMVMPGEEGRPEVLPARWGLIPTWWKNTRPPSMAFNARSEEAAQKPMWRQPLRLQRCLMPAAGWYEWNEQEPVRSPNGRTTHQPYYIHSPNDEMIAFAALWSRWHGPNGQEVLSCALLTKEAAPSIRGIHHRMPVVLSPHQFELWLSTDTAPQDVSQAIDLARQDFTGYRVSTAVNNTRNDYPELLLG